MNLKKRLVAISKYLKSQGLESFAQEIDEFNEDPTMTTEEEVDEASRKKKEKEAEIARKKELKNFELEGPSNYFEYTVMSGDSIENLEKFYRINDTKFKILKKDDTGVKKLSKGDGIKEGEKILIPAISHVESGMEIKRGTFEEEIVAATILMESAICDMDGRKRVYTVIVKRAGSSDPTAMAAACLKNKHFSCWDDKPMRMKAINTFVGSKSKNTLKMWNSALDIVKRNLIMDDVKDCTHYITHSKLKTLVARGDKIWSCFKELKDENGKSLDTCHAFGTMTKTKDCYDQYLKKYGP